jgi:hypothetical protein
MGTRVVAKMGTGRRGGEGESEAGPRPEHPLPGKAAGFDAGYLVGLVAVSSGRAPPPPPPVPAAAERGAVASEGHQPPRPPFLALLEDFPGLFRARPRHSRAHGERAPHRGEELGPAARRWQREGGAGLHKLVLQFSCNSFGQLRMAAPGR